MAEKLTRDINRIYRYYDTDFKPEWVPLYSFLLSEGTSALSELIKETGYSRLSGWRIMAEMTRNGIIEKFRDDKDRRKWKLRISPKGLQSAERIRLPEKDIQQAIGEMMQHCLHNISASIGEWESLLEEQAFFDRVLDQRKKRETQPVTITDYEPKYRKAFRDLNEEWISGLFKMEKADYLALDNPESHILDKGGHILVALLDDEPVGVCALIRMQDKPYDFELAKMAVAPKAQGKNIGWQLGQAIIEKAVMVKAKSIYLESNTKLRPAISLYRKLGFTEITGQPSPYERCDIQMELTLQP